jgi:serine protease Do
MDQDFSQKKKFKIFTSKIRMPHLRISRSAKRILGTIGISILSSVLVVATTGILAWHYRTRIVSALLNTDKFETSTHDLVAHTSNTSEKIATSDLSVTDVVAAANKSVVSIEVYQPQPVYATDGGYNPFGDLFPGFSMPTRRQIGTQEQKVGGGTGFFVTSDGLIVTNRHVVDFSGATFKAITSGGDTYTATVIAKDPVLDIALLRVTGSNFTPLPLGDSDKLQLGQSVIAIGYALGQFNNSISVGVVSGLSRSITAGDESGNSELLDKVIQTDTAINPGNSGGPLLNLRGEVVGVNVAVAQGSQNVGFSLPINSVKGAIESVKKTGTIVRPYVGIRYVQITEAIARANKLPYTYGVLIKGGASVSDLAVIPGSPADKAGLVENDVILSINGTKLDENTSFASIIRGYTVGQTVTLDVWSKGVRKTISLTLAKASN